MKLISQHNISIILYYLQIISINKILKKLCWQIPTPDALHQYSFKVTVVSFGNKDKSPVLNRDLDVIPHLMHCAFFFFFFEKDMILILPLIFFRVHIVCINSKEHHLS